MIRTAVAVLCLVAIGACGARRQTHSVNADGNVELSGVTLPATAGPYRLTDLEEGRRGRVIAIYAPPDSVADRLPEVAIVVYEIRGSLEEELRELRAQTFQRDRSVLSAVEASRYRSEEPVVIEATGQTAHRALIELSIGTIRYLELRYVQQRADQVLIGRVVFRSSAGSLEPFFSALIEDILARATVAPGRTTS